MTPPVSKQSTFRLDPDRLQEIRLRKSWTQKELAQASGFSEDYISQLERAATTHNRGTKLETIAKLASSLHVPIEALLRTTDSVELRQQFALADNETLTTTQPISYEALSTYLLLIHSSQQASPEVESEDIHRQEFLPVLINPEQLREHRLRKQWTQKKLASASGFSEDYISQLERAATTRNKGTKIETIAKLASALDVAIEELLIFDGQDDHQIKQYLQNLPPYLSWQSVPLSHFSSDPVPLLTKLLESAASFIQERGLWLEAERKALEVRALFPETRYEWADITLRHAAYLRQQAGDITGAYAHMETVQERYISRIEKPHPQIIAHLHCRRGWIDDEQYGKFAEAYKAFSLAIPQAVEVGDRDIEGTARHFRFRALVEMATAEGGTWLGVRPNRSLSSQRLKMLAQSFSEDWTIAQQYTPESPHHSYYRFMMYALLRPQEAQKEISHMMSISQQKGMERFLKLHLARWQLSNQEWEVANAFAQEAAFGFRQASFPYGVAFASALQAKALFQGGLQTKRDLFFCADLWVLVLLLHPYDTHPLFQIARSGLHQVLSEITTRSALWFQAYTQDLSIRIAKKEGVFEALRSILVPRVMMVPNF